MLAGEIDEGSRYMPEEVGLALAVLKKRIGSLSREDRADLFELMKLWRDTESQEDEQSIIQAIAEILAQQPLKLRRLPTVDKEPMGRKLKNWSKHVGRRIKHYREEAGLTQIQLAEKADLPQSHISRLENAEHSATNMTLEKIAKALGITVGELDPVVD